MGYNKVILIGRATDAPELKTTAEAINRTELSDQDMKDVITDRCGR